MSISTKFSLKSSKTIARLTTPVFSPHGPQCARYFSVVGIGDVVPRPGAVPKSTAGSTPLFVVVPKHAKGGEENGEQAESMESGASYAIAQKRGPSYARSDERPIVRKIGFRVPYEGGGPCQRKKSEAAQPENLGRGRGETVGGHGT